jgi:dolichol-phosphate mannosyltransferase
MVPLYNEEQTMEVLRRALSGLHRRLSGSFKVCYLFVDDGSQDETFSRIRSTVPPGAEYEAYRHPENRGLGEAFRTAFLHANADVVCTIDGDCSYRPSDLFAMILRVLSGHADIVVASPYHPLGDVEGVQGWRLALSSGCSRLYRAFTPLKLYTYTSIFRAYRGSVVKELRSSRRDFVATVELLLSASSMGCKIEEAPLVLHRRCTGCSKMRIARTISGHLGLLSQCILGHGYPASLKVGKQLVHPPKTVEIGALTEERQRQRPKALHSWDPVTVGQRSQEMSKGKKGVTL